MLMPDLRFYLTPGSRWVTKTMIKSAYSNYRCGAEFFLFKYYDSQKKLAINCPSHHSYFESYSDARRFECEPLVTGTINYSKLGTNRIGLIQPSSEPVYFIRHRDNKFFSPEHNGSGPIGSTPVFSNPHSAWKELIMDASKIMRARDWFDIHPFSVHAFYPVSETESRLEIPQWKISVLKWVAVHLHATITHSHTLRLVDMILKMNEPPTIAKLETWSLAEYVAVQTKSFSAGRFIFFDSEEKAVMAKLTSIHDIDLLKPAV